MRPQWQPEREINMDCWLIVFGNYFVLLKHYKFFLVIYQIVIQTDPPAELLLVNYFKIRDFVSILINN